MQRSWVNAVLLIKALRPDRADVRVQVLRELYGDDKRDLETNVRMLRTSLTLPGDRVVEPECRNVLRPGLRLGVVHGGPRSVISIPSDQGSTCTTSVYYLRVYKSWQYLKNS